ncbi:MAG TPA: glycosyl hydrolase [Gemmatimonadaceae bacterium]|nr:glycosyl hydrolase [Gemmatimonadaceae bacterium]
MRTLVLICTAAGAITAAAQAPSSAIPGYDSARFGVLRWRSIGPYRGGRSVAVAGVPSQPLVYYAGFTGGGLWKTEDGGNNWRNISDCCFRMGSVGGIAVAADDPNVIYVGMGEHAVRGQSSSWGDGVYKSTDAGRTWKRVGLENTRQISRVLVHPRNDDVVYVAAQGSRWAPGAADRGIFRSVDGGKSWKLILHPSDSTAATELSMDATNPRILYAAFSQMQRVPWQVRSGGTQSGIWKSLDGGDTWTRLEGLPRVMGKIGVAASPANPDRIYAIVEADSGGLWRSDDAGKTWRLMSDQRLIRARAWYYTNVTADPRNADVVYVMNAPITKSIDGGRTFAVLPAPHGDNHQLWINPTNSDDMIAANDGGATISMNAGRTWSTQNNQPTAQIYRVNTDRQFPYWVYGAQQDNSSLTIPSATSGAGIDATDWYSVAGCESAHLAFDPAHPRYIYGGCYQGMIEEFDRDTRLSRNVMAWPALSLAQPTNTLRYRFNWSAPIATSPNDRNVIYHGGNVLFRSSDRGNTWTTISPDLTRNDPNTQGFGGTPITNEGAGGEVYNTIYYIAESEKAPGMIWVGTDDGLVQLTRDGGRTWTNVTPKGLPPGQINAIEPSPNDAETAYIAFYRVKWNDNAPYIYKTHDGGKSWTPIVSGLPVDEAARVVREGRLRRGMLYAGTETGAWISFDDGGHWQSIQGNLPHVPVTDLQVSGTGDLVASTEGRAFWILDAVYPFPQGLDTTRATRLFAPRNAYRTSYGFAGEAGAQGFGSAPLGQNPPPGAVLYFYLANTPDTTANALPTKLEILGADGRVIRTYSSKRQPPPAGGTPTPAMTVKQGLNRVVWDLRTEPLAPFSGVVIFVPTEGYRVAPGDYTVRLTAEGKTLTQPLKVLSDPRLQMSAEELAREQSIIEKLNARAAEIFQEVRTLRSVRDQVNRVSSQADLPNADSVKALGKRITARIDTLEQSLVQVRSTNGQDVINYPPGLISQVLFLADAVDASGLPPTRVTEERMGEIDVLWQALDARVRSTIDQDVARLNSLLAGAPAVVVPARKPVP